MSLNGRVTLTGRIRRAISVGADLTQLALAIPLLLSAAVVLAGILAGLAVPVLLATTSLLAILSGYWWWRARSLANELRQLKADAKPATARAKEPPSRWLPRGSDLAGLQMTAADLEESLNRAEAAAESGVGPEPSLSLNGIFLLPDPFISFEAVSNISGREGTILVSEYTLDLHGVKPARGGRVSASAPWRSAPEWAELVKSSWPRVQPFVGSAILSPKDGGGWSMAYQREHQGVVVAEDTFETVDGAVTRL